MANGKNVLILKQLEQGYSSCARTLSGIVRLEKSFGVTELSLSLVNVSALVGGEFFLYIFGQSAQVYTFALSALPNNFHKTLDGLSGLDNGFAGALVAVKSDIPVTVAFGATENFELSISSAKKLVAEKCLADRKTARRKPDILEPSSPPPVQAPAEQEQPKIELVANPCPAYDDEAVATVNYYELDDELKQKIEKINELENEKLSNADGDATDKSQEEKEKNSDRADFLSNEEDLFAGESQERAKPFFITAEKELETLFAKFPRYDNLLGYFPDSRWVKINYDKDNYYIVGVIKENEKEKYICYGVPAKYSPEPPKELRGYCSFIPLSIFDMQGDGFWMMFQDAVSGECVSKF